MNSKRLWSNFRQSSVCSLEGCAHLYLPLALRLEVTSHKLEVFLCTPVKLRGHVITTKIISSFFPLLNDDLVKAYYPPNVAQFSSVAFCKSSSDVSPTMPPNVATGTDESSLPIQLHPSATQLMHQSGLARKRLPPKSGLSTNLVCRRWRYQALRKSRICSYQFGWHKSEEHHGFSTDIFLLVPSSAL